LDSLLWSTRSRCCSAAPTDKCFCHLMWTYRLHEDLREHFVHDWKAIGRGPRLAEPSTQYALKGLERQLQTYRDAMPPELVTCELLFTKNLSHKKSHCH